MQTILVSRKWVKYFIIQFHHFYHLFFVSIFFVFITELSCDLTAPSVNLIIVQLLLLFDSTFHHYFSFNSTPNSNIFIQLHHSMFSFANRLLFVPLFICCSAVSHFVLWLWFVYSPFCSLCFCVFFFYSSVKWFPVTCRPYLCSFSAKWKQRQFRSDQWARDVFWLFLCLSPFDCWCYWFAVCTLSLLISNQRGSKI